MAQEASDHTCLQHVLSLLYRSAPSTAPLITSTSKDGRAGPEAAADRALYREVWRALALVPLLPRHPGLQSVHGHLRHWARTGDHGC